MQMFLLVGAGGFAGAVLRYSLTLLLTPASAAARFPLGTLVVNVLGCLAIGALAAAVELHGAMSYNARMLLFTGVLGGFTTFSAFGYETFTLMREQGGVAAGVNVLAQLVLGLAAVWLGHLIVSAAAR